MARAEFRQLGALLKEGSPCRVVLLHGDDPGLIRERGDRIAKLVSGGDSLRLVDVPKEASRDVGLLRAEAATAALIGGRRAVRVRDVGDAFLPAVRLALSGLGPGIVILEGSETQNRAKLRPELEASPAAAVVECAQQRGAALEGAITTLLGELGATVEADAVAWLADRLGEDRQVLRRECEKLALYAGAGSPIDLATAIACLGDAGGGDAEGVAAAALSGDLAALDRALDAAFAEGGNAVQLLRSAIWQAQRLLSATLAMGSGNNAAAAIRGLRPGVHPNQREQFERAVRLWDPVTLGTAGAALIRAERRAKTTGLPETMIARDALLSLARTAKRRR